MRRQSAAAMPLWPAPGERTPKRVGDATQTCASAARPESMSIGSGGIHRFTRIRRTPGVYGVGVGWGVAVASGVGLGSGVWVGSGSIHELGENSMKNVCPSASGSPWITGAPPLST